MLISLPLARYRFQFMVLDRLLMPAYPGALWHSVLGKSLHDLVCVAKSQSCEQCLFLHQCDYTQLFRGTRPPDSAIMRKYTTIPPPHIIQVSNPEQQYIPGQSLTVDVILPGTANEKLPSLIRTFYKAGLDGLGKHRSRVRLQQVTQILPNTESYDLLHGGKLLPVRQPQPVSDVATDVASTAYVLRWRTPYKPSGNLQRNKQDKVVDAGRLLMAIIRRVDLIQYFYTGQKLAADFKALKDLTEKINVEQGVYWVKQQRYSAAGKHLKDTSGFMGELSFDLCGFEALKPFLAVGAWLNVGKNASLGFGQYRVYSEEAVCRK